MNMLVGVDMSRIFAGKETERGELAIYLVFYGPGVIQRNLLIQGYPFSVAVCPFTKVQVQAETQFLMPSSVSSGLCGPYPVDHQAGTRHDAMLECLNDTPVHTKAQTKIVGIDDQITFHFSNLLLLRPDECEALAAIERRFRSE